MQTQALMLVLISAAMHAAWNVLAKRAEDPTAFFIGMEVSSLLLLIPALVFLVSYADISLWLSILVGCSALLHALYAIWLARAYAREDLTIVYPIVRSSPAVVALLAWLILGERLSMTGSAAIGVVVGGVWLLQAERPQAVAEGSRGLHFAFLALGATAAYTVVDKAGLRAMEQWSARGLQALAYLALVYVPYVLALAWFALRDHSRPALVRAVRRALPRAVVAGMLGLGTYALVLEALRSAPVAYVAAARQASVPFAALAAGVITKERIGVRRGVGLAVVTLGVAWLWLA